MISVRLHVRALRVADTPGDAQQVLQSQSTAAGSEVSTGAPELGSELVSGAVVLTIESRDEGSPDVGGFAVVLVAVEDLRRHVLGGATGGLADRAAVLVFAVAEVAQLDDGQRHAAVEQHVVQLRNARAHSQVELRADTARAYSNGQFLQLLAAAAIQIQGCLQSNLCPLTKQHVGVCTGGTVHRISLLRASHLDVPVGDAQPMAVVDRYDQLLEKPSRIRLRYPHLQHT